MGTRYIRKGNHRFDTDIPELLMQRLINVADFLGLTKRGALLAIMDEGCAIYERKMLDAEQAREQASTV